MDKNTILSKFISTQGYKRNSPDVNKSVNVIPSNQITMEGVDFPVIGIDNLGNKIVMQPGQDYTFPGDYVIETPIKQKGGTYQKSWWMPEYTEPKIVNDNIKGQTKPTWLQQGIADLNKMDDVAFEKKYKVHKHGWALMNSPEYAAEVEANIDRNNPNTIDYPKTSYLSRNYQGNPNLGYTRTNQSGTDMIKAMEMAHMDAVGAVLPIPGLEAMGKIPSMFKAGQNLAKLIKPVSKVVNKVDDVIKQVDNIPLQKPNDMLNLFKQNEINWLNSEEYIMRKMKATGKSKETIIKEKNEILKQLDRTTINFLDESPDLAKAIYSNGKKPNINIFNNNTESNLSALDHEIKHAGSEQAIRSNDPIIDLFNNPYKKYPVVNTKKWYDYLIPFETNSKWASNAPEQQVISKRVMDNVEYSQGLKRGTKLTEENISKLIDDLNIEIRAGNDKNSDIITMFKAIQNKFGRHESYKIIKDMINNAYSIPTTIGVSAVGATINTSNKQNGGEANWLNKYE